MLGKLFSRAPAALSGSSSTSHSQSSRHPESVQEDLHTRNLLFPDAQALYQHRHDQVFPLAATPTLPSSSTSNAFDYEGDIELEERDVRVLIMQGATPSSQTPYLLYDSHAPVIPQDRTTSSSDSRRNPTSPRKSSLSHTRPVIIQQDLPPPRQSAYERRGSIQSRYSYGESDSQKAVREYREEIGTFSSCIFANSEIMAYRGTSTKVHVIPTEVRPNEFSTSYFGDGRGSIGRSSARSSKLAQSFTSEVFSPTNPSFPAPAPPRPVERRKVLVTRLFPVHIPSDDTTAARAQDSEERADFPFPKSEEEQPAKVKPKMKKTPMYAIALVIQLPRAATASGPPRSGPRGSSSYTEQDSFSSSFSSTRRSGWTMVGNGFGHESLESSYGTEMEDQLDAITQHWDIIMRTLTRLQSVVATILSPMLKQLDIPVPEPAANPARQSAQSARHPAFDSRQAKPKVNIKYIVLPSDCLRGNRRIVAEVEGAKARIVSGLRATRVITGQGRWGIWREEARTVARSLGGRDQHFFFFTLMTAFLSTHIDWLQALSPLVYRKRYTKLQKTKGDEDMLLPARTIIVANDKIVARRLVFLLTAFLPANQQVPPTLRAHRPSTSASVSQSPPSGVVTIVREESLRRKVAGGRRGGVRQHSRNVSIQSQTARPQGVPPPLAHLAFEGQHERKSSDLSLMRQPSAATGDRKSSAATTATVTPETTIPHFATAHRRSDSRPTLRPGSSESLAADDLKRSLTRADSAGGRSNTTATNEPRAQSSRWGSVISGLWSPRRRDSTGGNTLHAAASTNSPMSPVKGRHQGYRGNKLADMVQEAEQSESRDVFPEANSPRTPRQFPTGRDQPEPRPGAFDCPVKTTVNAADGVIDVDVPFPDYLTNFETAVSSPSSSGYLSTPGFNSGLEAFEHSCRTGREGDMPFNVGGWLQEFHPDFALQAISPQPDLINQIKAALQAEPTPSLPPPSEPDHPMAERWVDVSTALVADSTDFCITRIRYKRLVRPKQSDASQGPHQTSLVTPSVAPYETPLEEQFVEEQIFNLEPSFTDAVEKVISQSMPSTTVNSSADVSTTASGSKGSSGNASASSSRSASKLRESREIVMPPSQELEAPDPALPLSLTPKLPPVPTEVPRSKCRTVVLSSLEELVLDVIEQRKVEGQQEGERRAVPVNRERESVLRAAVRAWLDAIDLGDAKT